MTMTLPVVTSSRDPGSQRRTIALVVVGIAATMLWTVVVNRVLWRQPLFLYPPRFEDMREHFSDFHLLRGGHDPYYLRFRFNDTTPPLVALLYGALTLLHGSLRALVLIGSNLLAVSVIFTASLRTVLRRPAAPLFALSAGILTPLTVLALSQAAYSGLWWGQDQIVVMALVVVDLLVMPVRVRGYLVGIAAGILLSPVFFGLLLLRPDVRSALRAAGAFLVAALASALVNGHASSSYWFHLLPSGEAVRRVYFSSIGRKGNSSLFACAARAPFAHHVPVTALAYALAAIVAVVGLSAAWWAQSQGHPVTAVAAVGLTTATISPVSWDHHWIWVILLPVVAIELWSSHRVVAVVSLVVIPLAFVRAYPLTRALPTTDAVVRNLVWSAPSLLMTGVLATMCVSLARSRARGSAEPEGE